MTQQIAQQQMVQQQQQQTIQQQQQQIVTQQQLASDEGVGLRARAPKISLKAGQYPAALTVTIKARSRGSVIFFTTDGWTPTRASNLYRGPIRIPQTTTLQAIAVSTYYRRSSVGVAVYTLPTSAPAPATPAPTVPAAGPALLRKGTAVPLIFTAAVTSQNSHVGDRLPVVLAEDLYVGGTLLAASGAPAEATVFQVDKPACRAFPA